MPGFKLSSPPLLLYDLMVINRYRDAALNDYGFESTFPRPAPDFRGQPFDGPSERFDMS